ncbi:hypothetical protein MTO96_016736 [Rhipicephalus appendiculatus]
MRRRQGAPRRLSNWKFGQRACIRLVQASRPPQKLCRCAHKGWPGADGLVAAKRDRLTVLKGPEPGHHFPPLWLRPRTVVVALRASDSGESGCG